MQENVYFKEHGCQGTNMGIKCLRFTISLWSWAFLQWWEWQCCKPPQELQYWRSHRQPSSCRRWLAPSCGLSSSPPCSVPASCLCAPADWHITLRSKNVDKRHNLYQNQEDINTYTYVTLLWHQHIYICDTALPGVQPESERLEGWSWSKSESRP